MNAQASMKFIYNPVNSQFTCIFLSVRLEVATGHLFLSFTSLLKYVFIVYNVNRFGKNTTKAVIIFFIRWICQIKCYCKINRMTREMYCHNIFDKNKSTLCQLQSATSFDYWEKSYDVRHLFYNNRCQQIFAYDSGEFISRHTLPGNLKFPFKWQKNSLVFLGLT